MDCTFILRGESWLLCSNCRWFIWRSTVRVSARTTTTRRIIAGNLLSNGARTPYTTRETFLNTGKNDIVQKKLSTINNSQLQSLNTHPKIYLNSVEFWRLYCEFFNLFSTFHCNCNTAFSFSLFFCTIQHPNYFHSLFSLIFLLFFNCRPRATVVRDVYRARSNKPN